MTATDLHQSFVRCLIRCGAMNHVPKQTRGSHVRFPGAAIAARSLGIDRTHLYRVLSGQRQSRALMARWKLWLKANPNFSALQSKPARH